MSKPLPQRPQPGEKVTDYDDGDPYSCIAAGAAERARQRHLQEKVEQCYGHGPEVLASLLAKDTASVKTALYDIWLEAQKLRPNPGLRAWAAEQMARLGNRSLQEYDRGN